VIFAAREYRDDVRMRQTGGKVGLAQEALLRALEGFGDDLGQAWQDLIATRRCSDGCSAS
jgi:hypothetical protein